MRIVTASNGKKTVKMSKSEWQQIGKKAGWMGDMVNKGKEMAGKGVGMLGGAIDKATGGLAGKAGDKAVDMTNQVANFGNKGQIQDSIKRANDQLSQMEMTVKNISENMNTGTFNKQESINTLNQLSKQANEMYSGQNGILGQLTKTNLPEYKQTSEQLAQRIRNLGIVQLLDKAQKAPEGKY
jgi:hypothetical protein